MFKPKEVCEITNTTHSNLSYWRKLQLVKPESKAERSGYSTFYSFRDLLNISLIASLNASGFNTSAIRNIIDMIDKHSMEDLQELIMVTDGIDYFKFFNKDRNISIERSSVFMIQVYKEIETLELYIKQLGGKHANRNRH